MYRLFESIFMISPWPRISKKCDSLESVTDRHTDGRTDGPTDQRTDARTDPHIQMRGRIFEQIKGRQISPSSSYGEKRHVSVSKRDKPGVNIPQHFY